jgi:hypothetical protein
MAISGVANDLNQIALAYPFSDTHTSCSAAVAAAVTCTASYSHACDLEMVSSDDTVTLHSKNVAAAAAA